MTTKLTDAKPAGAASSEHIRQDPGLPEDPEILDAYSRAVVDVVENVGPTVVHIAVRQKQASGQRPKEAAPAW